MARMANCSRRAARLQRRPQAPHDHEARLNRDATQKLLEDVAAGRVRPADAMATLQRLPFEDIGFARVDHHRAIRCGFPEVIFGGGKTPEHILGIFERLAAARDNVLATRVAPEAASLVCNRFSAAEYHELSRTLAYRSCPPQWSDGFIAVVCAGTSDLPVAEEARITAEMMDQRVRTFYDVGVAGIHRLLAQSDALREANAVVVVAGMEGALPSVVGGLVAVPVVAVPTSVGYGASFGGVAALLAMLNSCASGLSVVNIDNGFGAGYQASLINRLAEGKLCREHDHAPAGRVRSDPARRDRPETLPPDQAAPSGDDRSGAGRPRQAAPTKKPRSEAGRRARSRP